MIPSLAFDDLDTRIVLDCCTPHPTLTHVLDATGAPRTTVWQRMEALRDAGLVTWDPGKRGTIRATVGRVQ